MSVFSEVFNALPRQGPGSRADTLQALESVRKHLPDSPRILDVGCGAGIQSLTLARHTGGQVLATDLSASLLEILDSRAREEGLDAQIQTVKASMKDLPFEAGSFDLVWSEGAIYIMGFEAGLRA
jgi:ubiquinone/menaquinone biosynthesis C-methylase UbiE